MSYLIVGGICFIFGAVWGFWVSMNDKQEVRMWDKRAYFKNYYLKHREEMIERSKAWNEEHPGRNQKYYINKKLKLIRRKEK